MDRTPVQNVARLVGIVFLLVGIAGFIPGITTNLYEGLEFAGNDGTAELLGIFEVSVLHNIVHGALRDRRPRAGADRERRPHLPGRRRRDLHRPLAARDHRRRGLDPVEHAPTTGCTSSSASAMIGLGVVLTRERPVPTTA